MIDAEKKHEHGEVGAEHTTVVTSDGDLRAVPTPPDEPLMALDRGLAGIGVRLETFAKLDPEKTVGAEDTMRVLDVPQKTHVVLKAVVATSMPSATIEEAATAALARGACLAFQKARGRRVLRRERSAEDAAELQEVFRTLSGQLTAVSAAAAPAPAPEPPVEAGEGSGVEARAEVMKTLLATLPAMFGAVAPSLDTQPLTISMTKATAALIEVVHARRDARRAAASPPIEALVALPGMEGLANITNLCGP